MQLNELFQLNKIWKQRNKTEKLMILVVLPIILLALAQFVFILPLETETKQFTQQITQARQTTEKIAAQTQELQIELTKRSLTKLNQQQQSLTNAVFRQQTQLSKLTSNLIHPQMMSVVVEKMLKDRGKLTLLSLENLPVIPLIAETSKETGPNNDSTPSPDIEKQSLKNKALLYRHPLQLKLRGRYFEILQYLESLETSGYKFYWDKLEYEVVKYPHAEVVIKLSTLGTEPQWMGASDAE